jgi:hypothetical protein
MKSCSDNSTVTLIHADASFVSPSVDLLMLPDISTTANLPVGA